jgi:hypothetical protein
MGNIPVSWATNACYTVVSTLNDQSPAATHTNATYRIMIAGYTGGAASCSDFAIDGFAVWGLPILYRIGDAGAAAVVKYNQGTP